MLIGSKRSPHLPNFVLSPKNLGGATDGEIARVTVPLFGLEATVEAAMFAAPGLKALAFGFGLNSVAFTFNFANVADGGPRMPEDFCGLGNALGKAFDLPLDPRISWIGSGGGTFPGIPAL